MEGAGLPSRTPERGWLLLGLAFFALYAFATLAPSGANWGLHALGYFPLAIRVAGLGLCLALLCPPVQERVARAFGLALQHGGGRLRGHLLLAGLGTLAFVLFYAFPIRTDIYGDTPTILRTNADNQTLPLSVFARIFDLHLLSSKEQLTLLLHRAVAHVFGIPIREAFRILSALSGAICLVLWGLFLRREFSTSRWGALLLVLGCLLGANQIFFGHVETYPFACLLSFAFLVVGSLAIERKASPWAALVLLLIAVKAHPATVYFVPAFLVMAGHRIANRLPGLERWLTWRRLALVLIVPSLMAAAGLYFFYFQSFHEPHAGAGREFFHSFLPIVPAAPPLDRYSLQSLNHLRDLANVLLLVGTPVLVALLGLVVLHRSAIDWRNPRVMFATLALVYPLAFFAALNPALSMPRDWDLYAMLGPSLLLFLATLLAHSDERVPSAPVHGTALAFSLFTVGFCVLNASPARLSLRLEDVGEYVFRTYHTGSSYILSTAQTMEPDLSKSLARRIATVGRLEPRVAGDREYLHLMIIIASMHRDRGDDNGAIAWVERAARVAPGDPNLSLWLADFYLGAKRTEAARRHIAAVLEREPGNLSALVQGAVACAQEQDFDGALAYLERARVVAPHDPDVASWTEQVTRKKAAQRRNGLGPVRQPATLGPTTAAEPR